MLLLYAPDASAGFGDFMRLKVSLSVAALSAAGLVAMPVSNAHADTTGIALPIGSYYQMAVDSVHDHLFFSQGSTSKNSILVTDFAGNTVTSITGQTGVKGITLSPNGSTLYAALSGAHAVTAISTATLTQTASYPLGDASTPLDVAVQSGKLWVSYDTATAGSSAIGDFDLSAASPAFTTQSAMGGWYSAPLLAADPAGTGNVLVAIQPGLSPADAASYNTSHPTVAVRAGKSWLTNGASQNCANARDLAVVPGGAQFIPACGAPYEHTRYSTADLAQQGAYGSTNYPNSIAIAAGNGLVAAGVDNPYATADIYVYAPGGDTPLRTYLTPQVLASGGLAMTTDGSELFAVTTATVNTSSTFYLNVYDYPNAGYSSIAMHGPASVTVGSAVHITGRLSFGGGLGVPPGIQVSVTRTGPGGPTPLPGPFTTTAGGAFTLSDTPAVTGGYTYTASYQGDSTNHAATGALSVNVVGLTPALSLTATPGNSTYEPAIHLTAHLGTTKTSRTVAIYAKPFGGNARFLVASGTVGSAGNLTASYPAKHSTTFSAVFAGDTAYSPRTVTATVAVSAKVTLTISGYYGTRQVGSVPFRLYHHTARLNIATLVAPNKHGQCVKLEVQEHAHGAWQPGTTSSCITLGGASSVAGYLTLTGADLGYGYRIRIDYIRGTDASNLSADSTWQYFMVER
jgi:hypothetical protein